MQDAKNLARAFVFSKRLNYKKDKILDRDFIISERAFFLTISCGLI